MTAWLWALVAAMAAVICALLVKIHLLQKSAEEIEAAFRDRLMSDTNTLIDISSRDCHMRRLASSINAQLRLLRREHLRFRQGDRELKNAVTNISHDLRTPLTAIWGYLELLEQEPLSETAARYVDTIRNRAELLTRLTEELFRYSIILSAEADGSREPVSIGSVLEEAVAGAYAGLSARGISPVIQITQKPIVRSLDRAAVMRVLSNLLDNAVKYSDGDLEITLTAAGEIIFSNTSSALTQVQVGQLFDRFYTVEAARKSTGLGLAIARTLVEKMGGAISAIYKDGRLSICIFFPETQG